MGDMRNRDTPDRATLSSIVLFVGGRFVAHPLEYRASSHLFTTCPKQKPPTRSSIARGKRKNRPSQRIAGCLFHTLLTNGYSSRSIHIKLHFRFQSPAAWRRTIAPEEAIRPGPCPEPPAPPSPVPVHMMLPFLGIYHPSPIVSSILLPPPPPPPPLHRRCGLLSPFWSAVEAVGRGGCGDRRLAPVSCTLFPPTLQPVSKGPSPYE